MIKAILFDFDGTLVNSAPVINEIIQDMAKKRNTKLTAKELDFLAGSSFRVAKQWLANEKKIKISYIELIIRGIRFFCSKQKNITFFSETKKLLSTLQKEGIRISIVSNAPRFYIKQILKREQIEDCFEVISTITESKIPKPHPRIVTLALHKMNLKPEECILVDDHENGIIAGNSLNMKTIRLSNTKIQTIATELTTHKELEKTIKKIRKETTPTQIYRS